jgi:DNA-binding CsgD family transcriptional regulator
MDAARTAAREAPIQNAFLEVLAPSGSELVPLAGDRVAVGHDAANDVALPWDATVSQLHAVVERYPSGWCVRDVGSRNGTYLNGDRIVGDHVLRPGDEIRIGQTRLVFRLAAASVPRAETAAAQGAPDLTRREREVLVALCRPVLERTLLNEPASIRGIATELVISESAVKKHLGRLYDKFEIHDAEERRRGRLVSDAIRRGAVTLGDVQRR